MPREPRLPARPVRHRRSLPGRAWRCAVRKLFFGLFQPSSVSRVAARAPASVDAVAFWSCTFTADLHERRRLSEANTWQMYVPDPAPLAKRRSVQIHPLTLRCLGFIRLTHLDVVGPSLSPFLWGFFLYTSGLVTDEHS